MDVAVSSPSSATPSSTCRPKPDRLLRVWGKMRPVATTLTAAHALEGIAQKSCSLSLSLSLYTYFLSLSFSIYLFSISLFLSLSLSLSFSFSLSLFIFLLLSLSFYLSLSLPLFLSFSFFPSQLRQPSQAIKCAATQNSDGIAIKESVWE